MLFLSMLLLLFLSQILTESIVPAVTSSCLLATLVAVLLLTLLTSNQGKAMYVQIAVRQKTNRLQKQHFEIHHQAEITQNVNDTYTSHMFCVQGD